MPSVADQPAARARQLVLTLSCPDRPGIVHAVAAYLHESGCNILDSQQFAEVISNHFFMRVQVELLGGTVLGGTVLDGTVPDGPAPDGAALRAGFLPIADEFGMDWDLHDLSTRPRVLIMVSKEGHCLNDLLYRREAEALAIDVPLVVGNHPDLARLAAGHGVPFEHVPVGTEPSARAEAEDKLLDLVGAHRIDFVVLARYMRILSPGVCEKLAGRIINIHHSFLPSFRGARPYQQAWEYGVKVIGATAHYVTAELDEGPVIEQEVARVEHNSTTAQLIALGRDTERVALARAVRWHAEHRILLHARRTVIFK
jgi:formyltetrahydrofolate deformylase